MDTKPEAETAGLIERLNAWSQNDPDVGYFFGGDGAVFSAMQLDCGDAAVRLQELAQRVAVLEAALEGSRLIPFDLPPQQAEQIASNLADEFGADVTAANKAFAEAFYSELYASSPSLVPGANWRSAFLMVLPFVDHAAGDGWMILASEDAERPRLDSADLCIGAAEALGLDYAGPEFLALTEEAYAAVAARIPGLDAPAPPASSGQGGR